ncbi:hypothetical protein GTY86_11290 [Streptomyces sp. SID5770]|uniref:hypothetical protein n=1 Tax=Streptomyces sp. SID5770 TaxID=2690308 RepID=UPI00136FAA12|nr:hypothetical protein [Streptomyces sp. SID5770]MZE51870.1 hypothetical protein [Streptomyces sp. SID5770]
MSGIDWGDAPTWIASVFAGGAAWFAGSTWLGQRKQLALLRAQVEEQSEFIGEQRVLIREQSQNIQLERTELRAQAEDRRYAQARAVEMAAEWASAGTTAYGPAASDHWEVTVRNRSAEPLRDVTVRFGDAYLPVGAALLDEEVNSYQPNTPVPVPLIGPRRVFRFDSARGSVAIENARPVLFFTDNAGVRWQLDEYGELSEAPVTPAVGQ